MSATVKLCDALQSIEDQIGSYRDTMHCIVREVNDSQVAVSIFCGEDEFVATIHYHELEISGVAVRPDEPFKLINGVVSPVQRRPLTVEDKERIDKELLELTGTESDEIWRRVDAEIGTDGWEDDY